MLNSLSINKLLLIDPAIWVSKLESLKGFNLECPCNKKGKKKEKKSDESESNSECESESLQLCGDKGTFDREDEFDWYGKKIPKSTVVDGVAIIPVHGIMVGGMHPYLRYWGYIDPDDIRHDVIDAQARADVRTIKFEINSPGGTISGIPELAQAVASCTKPTAAVSEGQMCSAAYWSFCGADDVFSVPSAETGSIGVFQVIHDSTKLFEMFGIRVELIKHGTYKGLGTPGTPVTSSQVSYLQNQVDSIASDFTNHVQAMRGGSIDDSWMQGQSLLSKQALQAGLIDQIVSCSCEVDSMLRDFYHR